MSAAPLARATSGETARDLPALRAPRVGGGGGGGGRGKGGGPSTPPPPFPNSRFPPRQASAASATIAADRTYAAIIPRPFPAAGVPGMLRCASVTRTYLSGGRPL